MINKYGIYGNYQDALLFQRVKTCISPSFDLRNTVNEDKYIPRELKLSAHAQDNMSESIPVNLPEQEFNCSMSQLLLCQFHKLMIGRYPFQNKGSKGLPSYLPKLDFIENILKFNCYMSQALFFCFLKCTVVMFFIKIIISIRVFQKYIKVGIQIFESLLGNVIIKKRQLICVNKTFIYQS